MISEFAVTHHDPPAPRASLLPALILHSGEVAAASSGWRPAQHEAEPPPKMPTWQARHNKNHSARNANLMFRISLANQPAQCHVIFFRVNLLGRGYFWCWKAKHVCCNLLFRAKQLFAKAACPHYLGGLDGTSFL